MKCNDCSKSIISNLYGEVNNAAVICQSFFSNFSKFSKKFFVTTVQDREKAPSVGSLTLKMTLMCPCPLARA